MMMHAMNDQMMKIEMIWISNLAKFGKFYIV